jgi:tetratricopeptide (TPR) repeat protein
LLALWQAPPQPFSASDSLNLLNGLGVGYTKQSKADSALLFLRQALPIAERLKEQEMLGTLYNNLGSANKLKKDWPQARQWLEKSLNHNRKTHGDSAAVLAYTYFHLASVAPLLKPKAKSISAASMRKRVCPWRSITSLPSCARRWRRF